MTAMAMTPEEVERGYNNREAVPDHPRFIAECAERSRVARETYSPQRNVRYGPNAGEVLDLFVPARPARGTFVFIHGGYWRALSKEEYSYVAGPMLAQDIACAVIDYDLAPHASVGTIVEECQRALLWVARHGAAHGAAPADVVVAGHSAGGHLAAMMAATDWTAAGLSAPPLTGALSLSGVHDLMPMLDFSYNADIRLDAAQAKALSPAFMPPRAGVPLAVACGGAETSEFLRQSQLMWDAWPQHRRPLDGPLFIPGKHHFDVVLEHAHDASSLTQATLALFGR